MEDLRSEIFRYLGYKDKTPDSKILLMVDECLNEIELFGTPKYVYKISDIVIDADIQIIGGFRIESHSLAEHLRGCEKAAVMAATLGPKADLAIGKYNRIDMTKAVVFNACANAIIEQACDNIEEEIAGNKELSGYSHVFRFSPGYGDFSLNCQKDILEYLNAGKNIGLTLTDSFLLLPTKSVTAVVGFFKGEGGNKKGSACKNKKCENCDMKDRCSFSLYRGD